MEKTLIVDDATARRIYPDSAPEMKAILEKSFPTGFFSTDITEKIRSFEDACEYNNTNPKASRFTGGTRNQIFQERVAEIVKALNEGWLADYNDSNQYKYFPWFYLNNPGFRFYVTSYDLTIAYSGTGSRFAFKSSKLAEYAGKQFAKEYENWMQPLTEARECVAGMASISRPKYEGDIKAWEGYIIPKIKTFEDACAETDENPLDYRFSEGTEDEIAYKKMKVIVRALNGGWFPDWTHSNQAKWYPWMKFDPSISGFRFGDTYCVYSYAGTGTGSRLRLCSDNLAKYFGEQFAAIISQNLL